MAKTIVTDELWKAVELLLTEEPPKPWGAAPHRRPYGPHQHALRSKGRYPPK
jgi:hypothetical protein